MERGAYGAAGKLKVPCALYVLLFWSLAALAGDLESALDTGGCALCHDVPAVPQPSRQSSCRDCHQWIGEVSANADRRARAMEVFPLWERYEANVHSYMEVPNLSAAMARLDPEWVEQWLLEPHDVRPDLPEGMPRFGLDVSQVQIIGSMFRDHLVAVPSTPEPDAQRVAEGAGVFTTRGCVACHTFGGLHPGPGIPMAPDLAHTRERMSPDHVAAWIINPSAVSHDATMPAFGLSEREVLAVRDYLLLADPQSTSPDPLGPPPEPASAPVGFDEVQDRVFGRICVHCHMDPAANEGRAGPGNAGGFGWAATGIELETYEGVVAVADRIPAALLRRRDEVRRDIVVGGRHPATIDRPERPGMPLGLPPLSDADHALVLGWIEQGMPR